MPKDQKLDQVMYALRERKKELKCLFRIDQVSKQGLSISEFLWEVIRIIPQGWQFPVYTKVKIQYNGEYYREPYWEEGHQKQSVNIVISNKICGFIEVHNIKKNTIENSTQFLPEEYSLLNSIASIVNNYIFIVRLQSTLESLDKNNLSTAKQELLLPAKSDVHWKWRYDIVQKISEYMDFNKFGVKAFYLIGSVKNASAGPASDIDILIHFEGNKNQKNILKEWFEGWSHGIDEINYLRTAYRSDGLIDLHIITDTDIENKDSFASMIGAVTDGARLIKRRSDD